MTIKSDKWIRRMAAERRMVERFESDEVCETSYRDRGGKYQGQKGVTLPRI